MIRQSFPDLQVEILDLVAEGDRVATFLRMSGTNTGEYRRGEATGRRATIRAFFIWRVAGGRLVESWGVAAFPSPDQRSCRLTRSGRRVARRKGLGQI